jgi:hypothetical protein
MAKKPHETKYQIAPTIILKSETVESGESRFGVVEHAISVMGIIDSHEDRIEKGSYVKTISESGNTVKLLDNHRWESATDIVGSPVRLRELDKKTFKAEYPDAAAKLETSFPEYTAVLVAESRYNLNTQKGRDIYELVVAGDINEYSVGIRLILFKHEEVRTKAGVPRQIRSIQEVQLIEYSAVIKGANPATMNLGIEPPDEDKRFDTIVKADAPALPPAADDETEDDADEIPNGLEDDTPAKAEADAPEPAPVAATTPTPAPVPVPQPPLAEAEQLISQALTVVGTVLQHDRYDLDAARRIEKTLANLMTPRLMKQFSLETQDRAVRIQFYRSYGMYDGEHDWWCRDVFDTHLTVFDAYDTKPGRHFAVDYQMDDDLMVTFAPPEAWREGRYEFVESAPPPAADDDSDAELDTAGPAVTDPEPPTVASTSVDDLAERRKAGLERLKQLEQTLSTERK